MDDKKEPVKNNYDLFNNPMVNAARKAMSESDLKRYETIGKELYNNVDFETSNILNNDISGSIKNALLYIEEGLKSGLNPNDLEEDEKKLLKELYGEKWIDRYIN
jgi:hypothetical protein